MGNSNPKEERPKPSDRKDLSQSLRAKQEKLPRRRRQRAELEELRRLRAKLEELRRKRAKLEELRRQRAEEEVSWFLPMMSPWSARNPPGFITEPEPSDWEDLSQRLRAKLEGLCRQIAEEEELLRCCRQIAELEKLHIQREELEFFWFLPMMSPWSARKPPGFITEPEPSDWEDLIQRLRAELEELPMSARKPPGFSTEPEPSDSEDQSQRRRAKPPRSVCPSTRSDRSREEPPDFSNEPEPSDSEWK